MMLTYFFMVSQGFFSCTYGEHNLAQFISDSMASARDRVAAEVGSNNVQVTYTLIETCFNGGILEGMQKERLYFRVTDIDGIRDDYREIRQSGLAEFIRVRSSNARQPNSTTRVILMGHSHGGWLAMKIAADWQRQSELSHLFTIDPISLTRCTDRFFILEKIWSGIPFANYFRNDECERAPSDLEESGGQIHLNTKGRWANYYQTRFSLLHSGAAKGATQNFEIPFPPLSIAHRDILSDPRVRTSMRLKIERDVMDSVFEMIK